MIVAWKRARVAHGTCRDRNDLGTKPRTPRRLPDDAGPGRDRAQLLGGCIQHELDRDRIATRPSRVPPKIIATTRPAPVDDRPAALPRLHRPAQRHDDARARAGGRRRRARAPSAAAPAVAAVAVSGAVLAGSRGTRPSASGRCERAVASVRACESAGPAAARCRSWRRRKQAAPTRAWPLGASTRVVSCPGDHMRVGRDEPRTDDPARSLRPHAARGSLQLHDGLGSGPSRPGSARTLGSGGGQRLRQPGEQRQRVEAVERLEDPVRGHRAEQARQDRGAR